MSKKHGLIIEKTKTLVKKANLPSINLKIANLKKFLGLLTINKFDYSPY